MRKVITTVGTSIIENAKNPKKGNINIRHLEDADFDKTKTYWQDWKNDEKSTFRRKLNQMKEDLRSYFGDYQNIEISAEIKSLVRIQEQEDCKLEVYLICTDTILSVVAADMIKEWFEGKDGQGGYDPKKEKFEIEFNHTEDYIIKKLIVEGTDASRNFKNIGVKGLINVIMKFINDKETIDYIFYTLLSDKKAKDKKEIIQNQINFFSFVLQDVINEIDKKQEGTWKDFVQNNDFLQELSNNQIYLNISGGYKAIIPILTILGQIYKAPLFYIYEDSLELIEIKSLPLSFDWILANKYLPLLNETKLKDPIFTTKYQDSLINLIKEGLLETNYDITIIGDLFRKYATKYSPTSNSVLGIFYEYMLYEYYHTKFKKLDLIERSYFIKNARNESSPKYEVDIYLEKNNVVVLIEAKAFYQIISDFDKIKKQIVNKMDLWENEENADNKTKKIKNFRLSIWTFGELEDEVKSLKNDLGTFKIEFEKRYQGVSFSVDYVIVEVEFREHQSGNSFNQFLKKIDDVNDLLGLALSKIF